MSHDRPQGPAPEEPAEHEEDAAAPATDVSGAELAGPPTEAPGADPAASDADVSGADPAGPDAPEEHHRVADVVDPATVRRAPRYGRFMTIGVLAGAVLALLLAVL
ncbi:hypothetical protein PU560_01275, partial [Georgenia sp. 10Sc9-8]|nr:hypothetical protein [Georgenia halotolerans]